MQEQNEDGANIIEFVCSYQYLNDADFFYNYMIVFSLWNNKRLIDVFDKKTPLTHLRCYLML